ncbi:hypothetical protein GCM10010303_60250 [Streptomyces purpurascens]|nr:hypothetical protein GCM10010303_60250 [Streptomyces purpurascens]
MDLFAVAEEAGVVLLGRGRVYGVRVAEECHGNPRGEWRRPGGRVAVLCAIFAKRGAREKVLVLPGPAL